MVRDSPRQTGLPILATGGSVMGNTVPEAVLMKEALELEYGVKVRWVEDRSRNTLENALYSAANARERWTLFGDTCRT